MQKPSPALRTRFTLSAAVMEPTACYSFNPNWLITYGAVCSGGRKGSDRTCSGKIVRDGSDVSVRSGHTLGSIERSLSTSWTNHHERTPMSDGYVKSNKENGIATVTFHHPKSNSLPGHILRSMAEAITSAGNDPSNRVIVLRSEGEKAFCAGASFDELTSIDNAEQGLAFFSGFAQVINAMRKAPVLVIGRIHAHTVGGGVGLAAAVDIAYAHEKASARLSELAIGIGPFVVGPALERKVGSSTFGLLSATPAKRREADWCVQRGLYAEIFPTLEGLDAQIKSHARELATYSPDAMAELKKAMWKGTEDWDDLLAERAAISGRLVLSPFTRDAIARFKAAVAKG